MVRVKYRYIVVKIEFENEKLLGKINITVSSLYQCIIKNVQKYYGDVGVVAVKNGLKCKYCNEQTRIAIIRIKHRPHRFVASVLPFPTMVGQHIIRFKTLYNGATIMQCNKFIITYQQRYIDKEIGNIVSAGEKKQFIKNVMNYKSAS